MYFEDTVRQTRRVLIISTEIKLSSDYDSKRETSTGSALLLYTLLSSIPPPILLSPILIDSSLFYYNMSQYGLINL